MHSLQSQKIQLIFSDIIKQIEKYIIVEFTLNNYMQNIELSFEKIKDNYYKEKTIEI